VLAWTHGEFRRQVIYSQPRKFLLWPALVFLAALTVGIATQAGWTSYRPGPGAYSRITDVTNPFPLLVWFYSLWNVYHFAMQDYGVFRLIGFDRNQFVHKLAWLTVMAWAVFGFPRLTQSPWARLIVATGMIGVNHWVVAIGLSARVVSHAWAFVPGILLAGAVGFLWTVPTASANLLRIVPVVLSARIGLSFVHYLYDRWVWKLSDPRVRATIGRELGMA
jgi:hypothetical protein